MHTPTPRQHVRKASRLKVAALASSAGLLLASAAPASLQAESRGADTSATVYRLPSGSRPHLLTVGADGAVWFSVAGGRCRQAAGNKIDRIAPGGQITEYALPTPDSYPGAIAVGADGALWFGERMANKIGRMTLDGHVTEYPVRTAVASTVQDVIVPGVECDRKTSSPAEGGMVVGSDGSLWFTEGTGNTIGRITTDGQVTEFPISTNDSNPIGIDLGPDGAVWFIERKANQVGRVTTDGTITEYAIPTPNSFPNVIVAGPDSALWFTELLGDNLARVTLDGEITEYPTSGLGPVGLAVGPDGALWLGGYTGKDLARMTTDGVVTDLYAIAIPDGTPGLCCGVVIGPDGGVWFTATEANLIGRVQLP